MTSTSSPTRRRPVARAAATALGVALLAASCAPAAAAPEPPPPVVVPAAPPAPAAPASDVDGAPALTRDDVDAWLDGLLPAALERTRIAGATVSVVHDGELLTARGYGWADTGTDGGDPVPVDPERTLFRVGSVSKLVTATAVLQLVEQGALDLDAPVAEHLDFDLPTRFDEPITLRHLLTHTAGFEERVGGLIGTDPAAVDLRTALAVDAPEQVYAPGTVPAYSNYGNALAGYVVERVSGQPFAEYVQEHVVEPAGMGAATFAQPVPEASRDDVARGYPTSDDPAVPFEAVGVPPAGSFSASGTDMAAFMLAQLGEPGGAPLLDADTLALMHAPALGADTLGTLADGPRMALGFFDESRNGHHIVGHGGDTNVFHSHLQLYPDERTGVFVSLNSSGSEAMDSVELREQLMEGFADRYFPAAPGAASPTVGTATAQEHAATVAGAYVQSRGMHSTFLRALDLLTPTEVTAQDDGRILLSPGPGTDRPVLYTEVEPWVWQEVGGQARIAARVTDGQVDAISWQGAFALLPAGSASAFALPVLLGSLAVLLVAAVAWPVAAVVRRVRRRPVAGDVRGGTGVRVLTRVAAASAVVAAVAWVAVVSTVMGLQEVPAAGIRVVQVLQGVAALGIVPGVLRVVADVRGRAGWCRVTGSALVLAALVGVTWFAWTYGLLAPSVSY